MFFVILFHKSFDNFFTIKIINNICPWHCIFNFFKYNNFRPVWSISFCKNVFAFWYSYMITNFEFESLSLISLPTLICILSLTSSDLILIVLWYVLFYLLTMSSNLSIYTFFVIKSHVFHVSVDVIFYSSNKSFNNNRFSFIMCWINFSINIF